MGGHPGRSRSQNCKKKKTFRENRVRVRVRVITGVCHISLYILTEPNQYRDHNNTACRLESDCCRLNGLSLYPSHPSDFFNLF